MRCRKHVKNCALQKYLTGDNAEKNEIKKINYMFKLREFVECNYIYSKQRFVIIAPAKYPPTVMFEILVKTNYSFEFTVSRVET